ADRAAADLRGGAVGRRVADAHDGLGRDRQPRAVAEHDRVEADAEARLLLELAAALDLRHRADDARAGRHRHAVPNLHVARDVRVDAILDPRRFARDAVVGLQAN